MHVGFAKEGSKIFSFGIIAISYDNKMVLSTLHSVIYFILRIVSYSVKSAWKVYLSIYFSLEFEHKL